MRGLLGCSLVAFVLAVPLGASAQGIPDVVRLPDGSFVRGTIVERTPTQIMLLLPNGESRVFAPAEVAYAGPETTLVQVPPPTVVTIAPPVAPAPAMARLHVVSADEDLTLQRQTGTASFFVSTRRGAGTAVVDQFEVLCRVPCVDTAVPLGTYQLGVARGQGQPFRVGGPIDVRGDLDLRVDYHSRDGERIAGWLTLGIGGALSVAGVFVGAFAFRGCSDYFGLYSCGLEPNAPLLIASGALLAVSMAVGLPLGVWGDGATLEDLSGRLRF